MQKHVRELPADKQSPGSTHVRIEYLMDRPNRHIKAYVVYGTSDADGNFQPQRASEPKPVTIKDRAAYESAATTGSTPSVKKDPLSNVYDDVADFCDANGLWHT